MGGFAHALQELARHGENRERANAIKAISGLRAGDPEPHLLDMLHDRRDAHRLSGLWVVDRRRLEQFIEQVAHIARSDANVRVRGRAAAMLQQMLRRMLHNRRERASLRRVVA